MHTTFTQKKGLGSKMDEIVGLNLVGNYIPKGAQENWHCGRGPDQ